MPQIPSKQKRQTALVTLVKLNQLSPDTFQGPKKLRVYKTISFYVGDTPSQFILVYFFTAVVQTTQILLVGQDIGNRLP